MSALDLGTDALRAALVLGSVGLAGGLLGPALIARIPEPGPPSDEQGTPAEAKELYRDIATLRGARLGMGLMAAVLGVVVGAQIGWGGALIPWAFLLPVGVILGLVDWRTRLLPTYLIAPSYGVLIVLTLAAGLVDRDRHALVGALVGWAVLGGFYLLMWVIYPRGMGYGDVRLSGLLGIGLGYLGWAALLTGGYAGLLVGSLGGFALSRFGLVDRRHVPFGPFMLLGAVIGVLAGPALGSGLGY